MQVKITDYDFFRTLSIYNNPCATFTEIETIEGGQKESNRWDHIKKTSFYNLPKIFPRAVFNK